MGKYRSLIIVIILVLSSIIAKSQETLCFEKSLVAYSEVELHTKKYREDFNCVIVYIKEEIIIFNDKLLSIESLEINREHDYIDLKVVEINKEFTNKKYNMVLALNFIILAEEGQYPIIILSNLD